MTLEAIKYVLYFVLGGTIVAVTTYFGSEKKGLLAAFFALFPFITAITLFTVYSAAVLDAVTSYVKGLIVLTPIWILYLACVMYLLPRYGFWVALASGIIIYIIFAVILVLKYQF